MDYQPSLPDHNDNVTHQHPLREFFLILGGLAAVALTVFWCLGLLIDVGVDHLSAETEAAINKAARFHWDGKASFAPDKEAKLQALADELRQCAGVPYPVILHLRESDGANAAVFPGGHILVLSGLLDKVTSRNGLAFVLAHELAHLQHRDHLRAMGRGIVLVAVSSALTGAHSDLTQLLMPLDRLGSAQYSQDGEALADRSALHSLNCLYGHAGGATEFFEAMKKDGKDSGLPLSHYFATHPQLEKRIDSLNRTISDMKLRVEQVQPF